MDNLTSNKVIIFGAGDYGLRFLDTCRGNAGASSKKTVVCFIDNDKMLQGNKLYGEYPCYSPDNLTNLEYDSVIIANGTSEKNRFEMFLQLIDLGVPRECIKFYNPPDLSIIEDPRVPLIRSLSKFFQEQDIQGNVAECGVNDGTFAKYINRCFPSKKLYLFDTFEGFTTHDIETERSLNDDRFLEGFFNFIAFL